MEFQQQQSQTQAQAKIEDGTEGAKDVAKRGMAKAAGIWATVRRGVKKMVADKAENTAGHETATGVSVGGGKRRRKSRRKKRRTKRRRKSRRKKRRTKRRRKSRRKRRR